MSRFRWIDDGGREQLLDDVEDLANAIDTGVIKGETLVHDARLDRWLKASEHDVLRALRRGINSERSVVGSAPPHAAPVASMADSAPATNGGDLESPAAPGRTSAHPWRRWVARITDYYLAAVVFGIATAFVPSIASLWDNTALASMAIVALFLPVEAWLLSTFGTTAGKALLGIGISASSVRPSFSQSLKRAWNVYVRGMGLGVPLVNLFTMAYQHGKVTRLGSASYDRGSELHISHAGVTPLRIVILVFLWVAYLALVMYGSIPG